MPYLIDEDLGITDQWILDYVVPYMFQAGIHCQVCLVLGCAILWRIFDPSGDDLAPDEHHRRVMARYLDLGVHNLLSLGSNPVRKVPLIIDDYDAELLIDRVVSGYEYGDEGTVDGKINDSLGVRQRLGMRRQEIQLLASQGKCCIGHVH